ncbi:MAG: zinc ribbon domain-containing protein [Acidimicrobiales bacterium]
MLEMLLEVQDHDTAIDRLRHRRANLPERVDLARLQDEVAATGAGLVQTGTQRDEVARRQKRSEDELAAVEAKIAEIEERLYSGAISIPRELQAMQAEVDSLRRRRSSLEDLVLEAMGDREPLDAEVDRLESLRKAQDVEGGRLRGVIAETEAAIDAELATETAARETAAATLPADLSTLYERMRSQLGGVAVARLVNGRCAGCHLTLATTELDRIRHEPPDALIRCEQCNRLLIRTF